MEDLTRIAMDYVFSQGACAAGVATLDTLEGGPPSADLTYVLPEAKSAVSFAIPLNQDLIMPFLAKKDFLSYERDNFLKNALSSGISLQLADYLGQKGHPSVPLAANLKYRSDTKNGIYDNLPEISLRYLAVASGVGQFGLSGNVITKKHGATVILGGVVTSAQLEPTRPLPVEENYCNECRLCMASCMSGMMHPSEKSHVTMGGKDFSYSKRRLYARCEYVCGGFAGLHKSGKWSTWTPARFPIPENDDEFAKVFRPAAKAYWQRPETDGGVYHPVMKKKLRMTCASCQLVCCPDEDERKMRYKALTESGVVVQNPDGSLEGVSPEEARQRIGAMKPEQRALYELVS